MREIKFRAFMVEDNHMETGQGLVKSLIGEHGDGTHYHVMQYTGLVDRNGVEIYEGDIVEDHYFKNSVSRHKVYWADNYGCWSTINLKDPIIDRKQLGYFNEAKNLHRNEYLEVIGNIYEHGHLLENESKE